MAPRSCCLLLLFISKGTIHAAFLLIEHVGESSLTLLLKCSQPGKPDLAAVAAKPQEDGLCGHHPSTSGYLAFVCSTLSKKVLIGDDQHVWVQPHVIHGSLPELVGSFLWLLSLVKKLPQQRR
jgi:hypothetical protein